MKKAVRWMFLGCFLALAAIWCLVFAFIGDSNAIFLFGWMILPILAIISFVVGFFHRGE